MKRIFRTLNMPIKRSTVNVISAIFTFPEIIKEMRNNGENNFQPYTKLMYVMKPNFDVPFKLIRSGENCEILITIFKPEYYSEPMFEKKLIEIQGAMEKMKHIIENT